MLVMMLRTVMLMRPGSDAPRGRFRRRSCPGGQPLVEPEQGRRRLGVLIAEPLNQLGGKGGGQGHRSEIAEDGRRRFRLRPIHPQETVDRKIGGLAGLAPGHDPLRRPAEICHQDDAQGDGDRPELADQERLNPLIGGDETAEHLLVETAVRMGDEGPGQAEDARISGQRPLRELGQLAIEARGKIAPDLADLVLDDVEIVDQPFGRRRDRIVVAGRRDDGAIGGQQNPAVVAQPRGQGPAGNGPRRDALGGGEAFGMLLETLDAEELGADGIFRPGNGDGRSAPDSLKDRQCCLSPRQMLRDHTGGWISVGDGWETGKPAQEFHPSPAGRRCGARRGSQSISRPSASPGGACREGRFARQRRGRQACIITWLGGRGALKPRPHRHEPQWHKPGAQAWGTSLGHEPGPRGRTSLGHEPGRLDDRDRPGLRIGKPAPSRRNLRAFGGLGMKYRGKSPYVWQGSRIPNRSCDLALPPARSLDQDHRARSPVAPLAAARLTGISRREAAEPVISHKFQAGQMVKLIPSPYIRNSQGEFEILRVLPEEHGMHQYRIKSTTDGVVRVVMESRDCLTWVRSACVSWRGLPTSCTTPAGRAAHPGCGRGGPYARPG